MKKIRTYYVVLDRAPGAGSKWAVQFGDYDRATAEDEMQDMLYGEQRERKADRRTFKMLKVESDTQQAIDAAVAALNAKVEPMV